MKQLIRRNPTDARSAQHLSPLSRLNQHFPIGTSAMWTLADALASPTYELPVQPLIHTQLF